MVQRLCHRGPDGTGVWSDPSGHAVLGHSRLAVLDPTPRADQPMVDACTGAVLVVNGEIYNFAELGEQLTSRGRTLRTTGDTEVLLGLLAEDGVDALGQCHGMFALALWEPGPRRLLLARDRLGIKPLFWSPSANGVVFASELTALLAHPAVSPEVDHEQVGAWLQLGYLPGEQTMIRDVYRLPPGHLLIAEGPGTVRVQRWYDLLGRVEPMATGANRADELVAAAVADAVRERLVSDVPLGCFLSGGVDSSLVAAAATHAGGRPRAVTVRFADGEDESPAAAETARALGLEHQVVTCSAEDLRGLLPRWPELSGDPIADPSLLPTHVVSRAARTTLTVALSGDGGDELLAGYPRLRVAPWLDRVMAVGGVAKPLLAAFPARRWRTKLRAALAAGGRWEAYQALQGVWPLADVRRVLRRPVELAWEPELLSELDRRPGWLRYRLLDCVTFLPHRMLTKVDCASMSVGLEVRVPLLDHRLVELLLSLPEELCRGKGILRRTARRFAPEITLSRRKVGFELPLARWLRHELRESVETTLRAEELEDLGLDRSVLRSVWDEHRTGRHDHSERLLAVMVLTGWLRSLGKERPDAGSRGA